MGVGRVVLPCLDSVLGVDWVDADGVISHLLNPLLGMDGNSMNTNGVGLHLLGPFVGLDGMAKQLVAKESSMRLGVHFISAVSSNCSSHNNKIINQITFHN